jgi:hypothetical protein
LVYFIVRIKFVPHPGAFAGEYSEIDPDRGEWANQIRLRYITPSSLVKMDTLAPGGAKNPASLLRSPRLVAEGLLELAAAVQTRSPSW